MKFNYYIPTRILFGKGMLNRLSRQELPGKKGAHRYDGRNLGQKIRLPRAGRGAA